MAKIYQNGCQSWGWEQTSSDLKDLCTEICDSGKLLFDLTIWPDSLIAMCSVILLTKVNISASRTNGSKPAAEFGSCLRNFFGVRYCRFLHRIVFWLSLDDFCRCSLILLFKSNTFTSVADDLSQKKILLNYLGWKKFLTFVSPPLHYPEISKSLVVRQDAAEHSCSSEVFVLSNTLSMNPNDSQNNARYTSMVSFLSIWYFLGSSRLPFMLVYLFPASPSNYKFMLSLQC